MPTSPTTQRRQTAHGQLGAALAAARLGIDDLEASAADAAELLASAAALGGR